MLSFTLRLEDTYWSKGFFNVPVDFERFLTTTEGPFEIFLRDAAHPILGRITRTANRNGTPRVFGNKPLADFFQQQCGRGALVIVEIVSPTTLRIR